MTTPNTLGQQVMADSMPVTVASDQPALPVTLPGAVDVSDRAGRQLGIVSITGQPISTNADVTDEPGRQLGIVSITGQPISVITQEPISVDDNGGSLTTDTPQLPAALVGGRLSVDVGASTGIDVTDRIARLLGVIVGNQTPADAFANPANALAALALGAVWNGSQWDRARGDTTQGAQVGLKRTTLVQAGNPPANTALTLTLPAAGTGLFHYITHIYIARVATAALAGGAILEITTTNLNALRWVTGNQASITVGTFDGNVVTDAEYVHPLRSAVSNTASTIVMPAPGAAVSWRAWCAYYTGP